jgi:dienelactone hydrolase
MLLNTAIAQKQTYVGGVVYRNAYQYVKLVCEHGTCQFSLPYLDGDETYTVSQDKIKTGKWNVVRGVEAWRFNTNLTEDGIEGQVDHYAGQQPFYLRKQLASINESHLAKFTGAFEDDQGRIAVIYRRYGYLHFISPYSEESMSLKPVGENQFWSISGETTDFSHLEQDQFHQLKVANRSGEVETLRRKEAVDIQALRIPCGDDTLSAQLYAPSKFYDKNSMVKKYPACLLLPGGGPIEMGNSVFEARFLAAHGIVSLIFDKPGLGQSTAHTHFNSQSFENKNEQYKRIFYYLRALPKVDRDAVGVHGPSEGGRLAIMMAIDLQDDLAFVNATAAPIMTLREGQLYAVNQHHRRLGLSEQDVLSINNLWNNYYNGIISNSLNQEFVNRAQILQSRSHQWFIPPPSAQLPLTPRSDDLINNRIVTEAHQIQSPMLLQYGENDERVDRVKSVQNIKTNISDSCKINTMVYPRGNHSFMTPEYKICPGYLHDKIKWLQLVGIL